MKEFVCFLVFCIFAFSNLYSKEWFTTGEFQRLNLGTLEKSTQYTVSEDRNYFVIISFTTNYLNDKQLIDVKIQKYDLNTGILKKDTLHHIILKGYEIPQLDIFKLSKDGLSYTIVYQSVVWRTALVFDIDNGKKLMEHSWEHNIQSEIFIYLTNWNYIYKNKQLLYYNYTEKYSYSDPGKTLRDTENYYSYSTSQDNVFLSYFYQGVNRYNEVKNSFTIVNQVDNTFNKQVVN